MLLAVVVKGANRHDMKLAEGTLEAMVIERPEPTGQEPQNPCLDKGHDYPQVRRLLWEWGYTVHICARGKESQAKRDSRLPGTALGGGADTFLA